VTNQVAAQTQGNFYKTSGSNQRDNGNRKSSVNDGSQGRPSTAAPVHNTIVLNEKATKQLLTGTDFQLQVNQGMLLDILLKELISIKAGQQPGSHNDAGALRVILENPQSLAGLLPSGGQGLHKEDERQGGKAPQKGSTHHLPNESLKDSVFQQSGQSRKGEATRRRDLESINEAHESKGFADDFESIKDDHMFSLSASHPAKDPIAKLSPQGAKNQHNKFSNANPPQKTNGYRPPEEGRAI
jgi:hypothetical protein